MSWWSRVRNVFGADRLNRELDEEMQAHIEDAVAAGRDPAEARRAFGPMLLERERGRDVRLLPWLDSVRSDLIFGWRQLLKNRTATSAAVLSLALAIGSCTAAFRLMDALLWRPLPVSKPEQLFTAAYQFQDDTTGSTEVGDHWSYPLFKRFRDAVKEEADLLAISGVGQVDLTFSGNEQPEKAHRQWVSGSTFSVFGFSPVLGRLLLPSDDVKPGAHPYAVISHEYWKRRFGGEPDVLGRKFQIADQVFEIVGVLPAGFDGTETGRRTDLYISMMMNARAIDNAGWSWFRTWVLLKPGVKPELVREKLQAQMRAFREERVASWPADVKKLRADAYVKAPLILERATAGASGTQRSFRRPLLILAGLVGLVLLIACTNVANLMTAQAAARAREMALRVSIGAGRWRLVQLVLIESAMLAVVSTLLGVAFSSWAAPFVVNRINAPGDQTYLSLTMDARLIAFGLALALCISLFFGLAPAFRASSVKPAVALKGGEDPHSKRRLMNLLIAAQVAFCFLVHFVSGLFVATHERLTSQPLGFSSDGVLVIEAGARTDKPMSQWLQLLDHIRQVRGVESASLAGWGLMSGNGWTQDVWVDGRGLTDDSDPYFLNVSPGWLSSMRIGLIGGRDFRPEEAQPGAAIVNESFAKKFFDGQDPVGKSFEMRNGEKRTRVPVVGYVKDARYRGMREPIRPTVYVPFAAKDDKGALKQKDWGSLVVKVGPTETSLMAPLLRQEIANSQKDILVSNMNTQDEMVKAQTVRERLVAMLSLFFAAVSLVLACVGLYGVLNYSVVQRRREIGIRLALGARAGDVARRVTLEIFAMLVLGSLAGLVAGMASERYLAKLLFGVRATDWQMVAVPLATIFLAAVAAAIPPVVRAVRINPAVTLRAE